MTALLALSLVLRMQDAALNVAQRNNACYALRGVTTPQVVKNMRAALADPQIRACGGLNLRAANAIGDFEDALKDSDYEVRAIAARLLGSFEKPELLPVLARAARDPQLIVATNAVEGLANYRDAEIVSLSARSGQGGRHHRRGCAEPCAAVSRSARDWCGSRSARAHRHIRQTRGMRVLAQMGDATDLPGLRQIARKETEAVAAQNRGFGLMPAISLSRAAQTTIEAIQKRM